MSKKMIYVKLVDPTTIYRNTEHRIYVKNDNVVEVPELPIISAAIAAGVLVKVEEGDKKAKGLTKEEKAERAHIAKTIKAGIKEKETQLAALKPEDTEAKAALESEIEGLKKDLEEVEK